MTLLAPQIASVRSLELREIAGSVAAVRGLTILVDDLPLPIGAVVRLARRGQCMRGEVVGFDGHRSIVMLLGQSDGITPGMRVIGEPAGPMVRVGEALLGRVLNGFGIPIDGKPAPVQLESRPLHRDPSPPLGRRRIGEPLPTGVRSIDGFLTLGQGQRIGIFSGAGVGKSTLLGSIARNTSTDVNVIALIGERGREVRDFIETALGPDGLRRSVVVTATSDESPLLRMRAASTACAIAEYFRDRDANVLLMMDSITRFAQAQRQVGLAVGEQPATRGYTPSVFAQLPVLLERAGTTAGKGAITGIYTVLVEGDDLNEPISDAARGVLDGHIVLSRKLASRGHYPAIDVLASVSRIAEDVCDEHHRASRRLLVRLLAAYADAEELINIGAYARGSNLDCDVAMALRPRLLEFLQQRRDDRADYPLTCRAMIELCGMAEHALSRPASASNAAEKPSRAR